MEDKASRDVSLGARGAPKGFENQSISIMSYHVIHGRPMVCCTFGGSLVDQHSLL